jgi:hypothetical protein
VKTSNKTTASIVTLVQEGGKYKVRQALKAFAIPVPA